MSDQQPGFPDRNGNQAWQNMPSQNAPQQYPGAGYQGAPMQQNMPQGAPPPINFVPQTTVNPVSGTNAYSQADNRYEKGARRGGCWRVVFIIALIVLVCALGIAGYILFSYWQGQNEYDELTQYMQVDDSGEVVTLGSFDVDWDALRAINPDIVAWVYVPGTNINYPVVWREHDDQYYLKRTFGDNSAGDFAAEYGCIMLSGENQPTLTDQVNIFYGHNMRNGSMFNSLSENDDSEVFNSHRTYYLLTTQGNYKLISFACDKVLGTSTDIVIPNFPTQEEYEAYLQARYDSSTVTPVPPAPDLAKIKQLFAFSTCDYPDNHYRIITYCYVNDYLPAGSDVLEGRTAVDEGDVANVEELIAQRTS